MQELVLSMVGDGATDTPAEQRSLSIQLASRMLDLVVVVCACVCARVCVTVLVSVILGGTCVCVCSMSDMLVVHE